MNDKTTKPRVYKDTLTKKLFMQKRRAKSWAGIALVLLVFFALLYVNWKSYAPGTKKKAQPFQESLSLVPLRRKAEVKNKPSPSPRP